MRMKRAYVTTRLGQIHLRFLNPRERGLPALDEGRMPSLPEPPPLVCLHPFPYSGAFFETIAPLLGEQRLICAPDCPGFGGSDSPERMLSMEELATTMLEALEASHEMAGKPCDLLGFHSGCLLAVEMARLQPDRVRMPALIDVPYFTPEEQHRIVVTGPESSPVRNRLCLQYRETGAVRPRGIRQPAAQVVGEAPANDDGVG